MSRHLRILLVGFAVAILGVAGARAQATRTWVSGVGDDANPCSRTAPCKTFAGAISKTAARGEINVLDPGGFGAVTITKSISIYAVANTAGVLVSGTNGIVVNAGVNDVVVLRGLDIEGLGTGLNGIRFLAGAALHVEDCTINGFTQHGIDFSPSGNSRLFVENTTIRETSPTVTSGNQAGIFVLPGVAGSANVFLDNVQLDRNAQGMRIEGNSKVSVRHSVASGNTGTGFLVTNTSQAQVNLEDSMASGNANGVRAANGAVIRINNMLITNNTAFGLLIDAGGTIGSWGNNHIAGNATDGVPNQALIEQ